MSEAKVKQDQPVPPKEETLKSTLKEAFKKRMKKNEQSVSDDQIEKIISLVLSMCPTDTSAEELIQMMESMLKLDSA